MMQCHVTKNKEMIVLSIYKKANREFYKNPD